MAKATGDVDVRRGPQPKQITGAQKQVLLQMHGTRKGHWKVEGGGEDAFIGGCGKDGAGRGKVGRGQRKRRERERQKKGDTKKRKEW